MVGAMRLNRLLNVIIVTSLLSSLFLVNRVVTAEDSIESRVNANFGINFETATDLKISAAMDVNEITVFTTTYNGNEIQNLAQNTTIDAIETMGAIKLRLRDLLKNQIETSFENANTAAINNKPTYENNKFYDEFSVNLTSEFFGMNELVNAYDFVNGVLDMGAEVAYTIDFQAESGWNNTYTITLSSSMTRPSTNGRIVEDGIRWEVENGDGNHPSTSAELSIQLKEPTTPMPAAEDVNLEFELDAKNANTPGLKINILTKTIDIKPYNILPDFITKLDFIPSDGIRLLIDNSLISWDDFYQKTIKPIEETTVSTIENSSLNQTLDMAFSWDPETTTNCSIPYEVTNMDNNPSIKAELADNNIDLHICGVSARALFGLANAGATTNISSTDITFGDKLDEIGYQYNGTLYLPDDISLAGKNIYYWNQSKPLSGEFKSDNAPSYSDERIKTVIEIEIRNADLNLISFFTGKTEMALGLYMKETTDYSVATLPDEFTLPEKVFLNYLNSDAFRLCIEENIFGEDKITDFLTSEKLLFENRLTSILPGLKINGLIKRDVFDQSLKWDGNIANMDADTPLVVASDAQSSYSLSFGLSLLPPKFEISNQSFNFVGLQNQNVTYRMIFPHGTTVDADDSLGRILVGKTSDGRDYIEISFNASESGLTDVVSCKIIPSALFVVGIFIPCIISLIILIVLIVVIYIIRRKRKQRGMGITPKEKKREKESEESTEGYEGEDYYIPPPPPSSK